MVAGSYWENSAPLSAPILHCDSRAGRKQEREAALLVLTRKVGESILLPDLGVTVTVIAAEGNRVRLGIEAPREVKVHREEVWHQIQRAERRQSREMSTA